MCPLADEVTLAMIYLAAFDCDPMKRGVSLRHVEIQVYLEQLIIATIPFGCWADAVATATGRRRH